MVLLISFLAGCEEDKTNLIYELKKPDDLSEEVYEVYSRIIDNKFGKQEYIVLQQETDTTVHEDHCHRLYEDETTDLDSTTMINYLQKNHNSYNLGTQFETNPEIKLITQEELTTYKLDTKKGWESFHKNYPKAEGVLYFTFPGFNDGHSRALFEYTWHTGEDQSEYYLMYLKKAEEAWQILVHEQITENGASH